jgi:signal transduction histidine kinase
LSRLPRYWRIPSDFLQDSSDNNLIYLIQVDQTGSSSELSEELEKLKTSTQQLQSNFDEALKQTREQLKQLRGSTVGAAKEGDLIELRETIRSCEESIRQLQEVKSELDLDPISSAGSHSASSSDVDVEEQLPSDAMELPRISRQVSYLS